MFVHLLHLLAGGLQILTGIEVAGELVEVLTDGRSHCQTAVGIDVDLANGALCSLTELFLGDTDGIGELSAVGVDDINILLRH